MVIQSVSEPARRIVDVSDAEGYSRLDDDEQRDLQRHIADIQDIAACNARLDRQQALVQGTGDGALTAWPPGTSELDLLADYLRELSRELDRVNRRLNERNRIRLRLGISAGIVEEAARGITGQAAIRASLLANSDQLREVLRNANRSSLAVIIDDQLYRDVVLTGRRGLSAANYRRVLVQDKRGAEHIGWITVPQPEGRRTPPAPSNPAAGKAGPAAAGQLGARHGISRKRPGTTRRRRPPVQVIVALISAVGALIAAAITVAPSLLGSASPNAPVKRSFTVQPPNLALHKSVTASSRYNSAGWAVTDITDGDTKPEDGINMGWTSQGDPVPNATEWVMVDLGAETQINQIKLYPRNDPLAPGACFPLDFTIAVSADGKMWKKQVSDSNYPNPGKEPQVFLFPKITARYIKVTATRLTPDTLGVYYFQLKQVEIFNR
jgi:hypothetical protein